MKIYRTLRGLVVACSLCLMMTFFVAEVIAQNPSARGRQIMGLHEGIEKKASLLKAYDVDSIRALADEVFNIPRAYRRMPPVMEATLKNRIVQAEMAYLQGAKPGVREQDLVAVVNNLVEKFSVPSYGKTSARQLRAIRIHLALREPNFMGRGFALQDMNIGDSGNATLSPLQAAHLMAVLIDQKLLNPDFQTSPDQWDRVSAKKFVQNLQASQSQVAQGTGNVSLEGHLTVIENPKRREMQELLSRSISSLSVTDAMVLMDQVLATLGID